MVRILLSVDCLVRNVVRCDVLCVDETDIGTVKAPVLTAKANTRINHRERIFMLLTVSICVVCSVCFPCIGGPIDRHLVLCWVVMVRFAGVPDPQTHTQRTPARRDHHLSLAITALQTTTSWKKRSRAHSPVSSTM